MTNLSQPSGDELIEECRRRAAHERSMAEPDSHVRRENAVAFDKAATTLQFREAEILVLKAKLDDDPVTLAKAGAAMAEALADQDVKLSAPQTLYVMLKVFEALRKALSDTGGER